MLIPFLHEGLLKTIFIDTWLAISVFGQPSGGFRLTLIDIIILVMIAIVVNFVAEQLTKQKVGSLFTATMVTIVGIWLMIAFVHLPSGWTFQVEDIPVVEALLGAIIVAVFYTLIRARLKSDGGKKG
ncbi:MAG TPA: hypothetical protein VF807_13585 [Ktedonobacterales bacterium]